MGFLIALQFLTRIPVRVSRPFATGDPERTMARSMAWFPAVGLLLGLLAAGIYTSLFSLLSPRVADFLVVAFLVVVTGNMHGDGLMDTADGIYSGKPRERMLEIMRDSTVGAHGVMGGILVILGKLLLLGEMPPQFKVMVLVLVPALGRWAQVYCAAVFPYARTGGGTGGFTDQVGLREVFWASLTVLAVSAFFFQWKSLILAAAVFIGTAGLGWYISRKIGGMTGDTLGAMNELVEVLALLVLLIIF